MECYSRLWGGLGNTLLAATSDRLIDGRVWPLQRALDPDTYATYQPTLRGNQLANPDGFEAWLNREAAEFAKKSSGMSLDDAREALLEDHIMSAPISKWELDQSVTDYLRHWSAPFAISDLVFSDWFMADSRAHAMAGFTDLMDLELTSSEIVVIRVNDLPPEIQLLVDTRTGALGPSFREELDAEGWTITEIQAGPDSLDALLDLAWRGQIDPSLWSIRASLAKAQGEAPARPDLFRDDLLARTPFVIGLVGCDTFVPFVAQWDERPIYIVVGDAASDYSLALSLDRGWSAGLWLPGSLVRVENGADAGLANRVVRSLGCVLHRMTRTRGRERKIWLTSMSLESSELEPIIDMIGQSVWGDDLAPGIADPTEITLPQPQRVLDRGHLSESRHAPFLNENMVSGLTPPLVPSEAESKENPYDCRWYVDVKVTDLSVPSRWDLSELVRQGNLMAGGKLRPGRDGIAVHSHRQGLIPGGATLEQMLERPRFRIPDGPELFQSLLSRRQLRAELSDKGKFAAATIERWGGLMATVAGLRDEATYAILHSFTTPQSEERPGVSLIDLSGSGRRHFLALDDAVRLTGRDASACIVILDDLVRRRILRRGLVLKCERCDFAGWYDLAHVDQGFECARCAERQTISISHWREPIDQPQLYYDLDEVVYQTLLNDGAVPLLALGVIADRSRDFMYSTEMSVFEQGGAKPLCEIDLWAVSHGEIIIGEAKRGNTLGKSREAKKSAGAMARIAEAVSADVLMLVTASDKWKKSSTDLVDKHITDLPTRLETLTDIAPRRPWE